MKGREGRVGREDRGGIGVDEGEGGKSSRDGIQMEKDKTSPTTYLTSG